MAQTTAGRKLGRHRSARVSLLRGLTEQLIRYEQIKTTLPKARECVRMANHLISVAKKDDLNARRKVARDVHNKEAFKKVFDVLIQRYEKRNGGYTQIFRLQTRQGDNAQLALIKLLP